MVGAEKLVETAGGLGGRRADGGGEIDAAGRLLATGSDEVQAPTIVGAPQERGFVGQEIAVGVAEVGGLGVALQGGDEIAAELGQDGHLDADLGIGRGQGLGALVAQLGVAVEAGVLEHVAMLQPELGVARNQLEVAAEETGGAGPVAAVSSGVAGPAQALRPACSSAANKGGNARAGHSSHFPHHRPAPPPARAAAQRTPAVVVCWAAWVKSTGAALPSHLRTNRPPLAQAGG